MEFIICSMGSIAARLFVFPVAATPAMLAIALTASRTEPDICCWTVLAVPDVGR
jgi:hypothetical protein